jgi:hypothetical protein
MFHAEGSINDQPHQAHFRLKWLSFQHKSTLIFHPYRFRSLKSLHATGATDIRHKNLHRKLHNARLSNLSLIDSATQTGYLRSSFPTAVGRARLTPRASAFCETLCANTNTINAFFWLFLKK